MSDSKRLLTEFGMGTSLRRQDYTEAATRALKDALWHNSINLAELFGKSKDDMLITVDVGVQQPDQVDIAVLETVFPYGQPTIHVAKGGLDIPRPDGKGKPTVIANVAISVSLRGVPGPAGSAALGG
jgi:uncharacterized protein (TIGR02058 family)